MHWTRPNRAAAAPNPDASFDSLTLLPVIPNPGKIVCVGLNYEEHRVETGRDKTESPALFMRVPGSQVGHGNRCPGRVNRRTWTTKARSR